MNIEPVHIVSVLGSALTALGGWKAAKLAAKPQEMDAEQATAAMLLASHTEFSKMLQSEIERLNKDHDERMARVEQEHQQRMERIERDHAKERERWYWERDKLHQRIDRLETLVGRHNE